MKIIVCIKQVPDTAEVRIDPKTGTLIREGVPSIMNPDDKAGLSAALKLKDAVGASVTALTMGPPQAELILREALAMGADDAVLLTDRAFGGADTIATSATLAAAISRMEYDLVIAGRQAIDGDTAQVGPQVAEFLGIPSVACVEDLELEDSSTILVRRRFEDRSMLIRVHTPCLVTALGNLCAPRYMTPGGIFSAWREKEIRIISRADLPSLRDDETGLKGSPTRVAKSFPRGLKTAGTVKAGLDAGEAAGEIFDALGAHFVI